MSTHVTLRLNFHLTSELFHLFIWVSNPSHVGNISEIKGLRLQGAVLRCAALSIPPVEPVLLDRYCLWCCRELAVCSLAKVAAGLTDLIIHELRNAD